MVGDALTFASPAESQEIAAIERAVGRKLDRRRIAGFDYGAQAEGRLEETQAELRELVLEILEAKIHGIGEVAKYYTGFYDPPVAMWRPYRNADCLKCHAESDKWLSVEEHTDDETEAELFADRMSCMSCHGSAHHVQKPNEMVGL